MCITYYYVDLCVHVCLWAYMCVCVCVCVCDCELS